MQYNYLFYFHDDIPGCQLNQIKNPLTSTFLVPCFFMHYQIFSSKRQVGLMKTVMVQIDMI